MMYVGVGFRNHAGLACLGDGGTPSNLTASCVARITEECYLLLWCGCSRVISILLWTSKFCYFPNDVCDVSCPCLSDLFSEDESIPMADDKEIIAVTMDAGGYKLHVEAVIHRYHVKLVQHT